MTWLWRALLFAFRRDFRRRHGAEVIAAIELERRESRDSGRVGAVRHAARVAADLVASAARQRRAQIADAAHHSAAARRARRAVAHPRSGIMDTFVQDVRYACRQIVRRPAFAAVAIASLALGIGGNTAVFGIVDGFVLHPFAFPAGDRLMIVAPVFPKLSSDGRFIEVLSPLEYEDFRRARSFAATAAFDLGNRNISGGDAPDRVLTAFMLDDACPVLGVQALLGRGFTPEDLRPGAAPTAVISHRLWASRFHGDASLVGRTIRVNGVGTTLVGVMPPGALLVGTDLWIPWGARPDQAPRNMRNFSAIARLADGATARSAEAELAAIAARVAADHAAQFPEYAGWHLAVAPLATGVLQSVRPAGFLVLGAVALVLVIACANLASLMLARATGRQQEFAVRTALGAGRLRLARQLGTEVLVLAAVGATAGLALAAASIRASNALLPADIASFGFVARMNLRVAIWCAASTLVATALVGIFTVWQTGRSDPNDSLKGDGRTVTGGRGVRRARQALMVAEIALAVMLAFGAGLLVRSFVNLQRVDTGVDGRSVITMRLTLPREKYTTTDAQTAFFRELVQRVEALPVVGRSGLASQFPPQEFFRTRVLVDGAPPSTGATLPTAYATVASPGYFDALGIALRAGRRFDDRDRAGGPRVVIVNDAFVARHLNGAAAIPQPRAVPARRQPGAIRAGRDRRRRRQHGERRRRRGGRAGRCSCRWSSGPGARISCSSSRGSPVIRLRPRPQSGGPSRRFMPISPCTRSRRSIARRSRPVSCRSGSRRCCSGFLRRRGPHARGLGIYGITLYTGPIADDEIGVRIAISRRPSALVRDGAA